MNPAETTPDPDSKPASSNNTSHANNSMNKPGKTGIARLIAATGYSVKGLKAAWHYEEAFRFEIYLAIIFVPLSFVIAETLSHQLILITSCAMVLFAELVNSAIEAIVDRISLDQHELSGQAKDIGSAGVFVAMSLFLLAWGLSGWHYFFG
jgi:diacylglycerol kinase (ATP)